MNNIFPTEWQRVIFRNYGYVYSADIAKVLNTDKDTVEKEAKKMGLNGSSFCDIFRKKGFVTVIRNNFDILPDEDIAILIGRTKEEYDRLLVEYDFLNIKLGEKPKTVPVKYFPLNKEQEEKTEKIGRFISEKYVKENVLPFDFYADAVNYPENYGEFAIKDRFLSHYSADYGETLLDDELKDYSEDYLKRLKNCGANGLWIHESLKNLAEFPFDKNYSFGYEKRVKNLKKLTERCKKFGVGVYLYLNEPRSMPAEFFDKYPNLKGAKTADGYCLCTSEKEVKDYLYNAVKSLAESVPELKAVMTITMSENDTHCYSRSFDGKTTCKTCEKRKPEEVAAEVNNIIYRALKDGNGYTRLIANLWGWSAFTGWSMDMTFHGIDLLDDGIEVLCVSEYSKKINRGGVDSEIIDYSISEVGPSEVTVKTLNYAKNKGHKIWAKMQINSSWECAGVPYIPAFDLMVQHAENLKKLGVCGLMLGWSLGGYPGGALPLISSVCKKEDVKTGEFYRSVYGKESDLAENLSKEISLAFTNFPFGINTLYFGGQNLSCANLYSLSKDNRKSTMVCFTFDDYEFWTEPYGIKTYIDLMNKTCEGSEKAYKKVESTSGNVAFCQLKRCALAFSLILRGARNIARFSYLKRDLKTNAKEILSVIKDEKKCTENLYKLMGKDAKIGFEATNHYFYTRRSLLEKLINLEIIEKEMQSYV